MPEAGSPLTPRVRCLVARTSVLSFSYTLVQEIQPGQKHQQVEEKVNQAKAYAVDSKSSPFKPTSIARREPTERDVQIEILFCGICHSDLHTARDEWNEVMPMTPPQFLYQCS